MCVHQTNSHAPVFCPAASAAAFCRHPSSHALPSLPLTHNKPQQPTINSLRTLARPLCQSCMQLVAPLVAVTVLAVTTTWVTTTSCNVTFRIRTVFESSSTVSCRVCQSCLSRDHVYGCVCVRVNRRFLCREQGLAVTFPVRDIGLLLLIHRVFCSCKLFIVSTEEV